MQESLFTHTWQPGDRARYNGRLVTVQSSSLTVSDKVMVRYTPEGEAQPITTAVDVAALEPIDAADTPSIIITPPSPTTTPEPTPVASPSASAGTGLALSALVEVKTLCDSITLPDARARQDAALADLLSAGWEILDISVLGGETLMRVITLKRQSAPAPQPPPQHTAAKVDDAVYNPLIEAAINEALSDLPIARAIREHGAPAVVEAMNRRAVSAGRAAYEARVQNGRVYTRIPGASALPAEVLS